MRERFELVMETYDEVDADGHPYPAGECPAGANIDSNIRNQIIWGDCLDVLHGINENSIDLILTSPPYDDLRDYKGYSFEFTPISHHLYRVLKEGGVMVWVVADRTVDGDKTLTSFKQALEFKERGFKCHDVMIYGKTQTKFARPNAYSNSFEYMFVFAKGKIKTFNPLMTPTKQSHTRTIRERKTDGSLGERKVFTYNDEKKLNNIWYYLNGRGNTTKDDCAFEHPALFPEKLAEDHILSWSNTGDVVLDPFCGSGTTCKMAKANNRDYIGIDISEEYCDLADKRIGSLLI